VTIGVGIGSSLFAALAAAAGVAVVRRRLAAAAAAGGASDGGGADGGGCHDCASSAGGDVGVSCFAHAGSVDGSNGVISPTAAGTYTGGDRGGAGDVGANVSGGGAEYGADGAAAYDRALGKSMVSSIADDLTVDGLFCTYPPRAAPPAQIPSDGRRSIAGSEDGGYNSSLSDHMDVDGLVRAALNLPSPPPPPPQ